MRVLMFNTPVSTHFTPQVPLAWALRAAGHEVLAAVQPDVVPTVESAGLNAVALGDPYRAGDMLTGGMTGTTKRMIEVRGRTKPEEMASGARAWVVHAKYLLPEYLDFARAYRPDLILSDMLEFTSLIVGGVLGVPVVHHRWGLDPISTPARPHARLGLKGTCERLGLPGLPDPTVLLDPVPEELRLADATPGVPIRYVPFNGPGLMPEWLRLEKPEGRRVVVSLGSRAILLNGPRHVATVLSAFEGMDDVEVLATVPAADHGALEGLPGNVRLIEPVPLHLLLPTCDAIVHHGGAGTAMTSTAAGVPQLALPELLDMFTTGDRLAAAGAGITLDTAQAQADVPLLRDSIRALLTEPSYTTAAQSLRRSMESMPSPARVVQDLEELAAA
ncbi:nucleotide disphospho-sugar-binding domain-containing protein [Streptomyces sp. ICBB 8177]|uniref:nucleotide disphospho-sugar-binding domain-containing protein n=1 Tax=Streptomyces sp. ICBB 8177 TaxID=563922 RepID=UPI000D67F271|nr:nucleotide disphospho-sugar-binding domain-containing protein [Streptomyces sp. ICBB 8177]PWI45376.1 glycosyl transferase [Streptomyces sp. ICBB 8177]